MYHFMTESHYYLPAKTVCNLLAKYSSGQTQILRDFYQTFPDCLLDFSHKFQSFDVSSYFHQSFNFSETFPFKLKKCPCFFFNSCFF